jgi:hypothetical protein
VAIMVVLSVVESVAAAPVAVAAPGASVARSPKVPAHPDADYLGSTVTAHKNAVAVASPVVAPAGTPGLDVSHYQMAQSPRGTCPRRVEYHRLETHGNKEGCTEYLSNRCR